MWELALSLALFDPKDPGHILRSAGPVVAIYETLEQCDAARWTWWRSEAVPEEFEGWRQFMPATCEQRAVVS